jgi:hypothetical protein
LKGLRPETAHAQEKPEEVSPAAALPRGSLRQPDASAEPVAPAARASAKAASAAPPSSTAASQEADPYAGLDHEGTPPLPPRENRLPPLSATAGQRRPLPPYSGKPRPSPTAGESLIWIPRVLFYPVHLVLEYGVRLPILTGITFAEEHYLFERVKRVFTFNEGKGGVFPTLFFDFGLNPSVGLYFFYDDLGQENHDIVLQAGFWAHNWYHFVAKDSFRIFGDDSGLVLSRAELIYRPDQVFKVFTDLTPSAQERLTEERFFRLRQLELELSLRAFLQDLNRLQLSLFYRNARITDGEAPSVADPELGLNLPEDIPGYGQTHQLLECRLKLELDSRSPDRVFTSGTGVRFEAFGSFNINPAAPELRFFRWGGELGGFWDITGMNHLLGLQFYLEALEDLGSTPIPLTERLALGGMELMQGFLSGSLRGDSAMVVTTGYRYPIWTFLDANLFASIGHVFRGRFEGLHPKRMALSWGFGLRSNTSREISFDLLLAFGTNQLEAWDEDFKIENVRIAAGINQGF